MNPSVSMARAGSRVIPGAWDTRNGAAFVAVPVWSAAIEGAKMQVSSSAMVATSQALCMNPFLVAIVGDATPPGNKGRNLIVSGISHQSCAPPTDGEWNRPDALLSRANEWVGQWTLLDALAACPDWDRAYHPSAKCASPNAEPEVDTDVSVTLAQEGPADCRSATCRSVLRRTVWG